MKNVRVSLVVQKVPTTNEQIQLELYEAQQLGGVSRPNPAVPRPFLPNLIFRKTTCGFVIPESDNSGSTL